MLIPQRFKGEFESLLRLMTSTDNNVNVREGIKNILRFLIDDILFKAYQLRQQPAGWSQHDAYKQLPLYQRIWLDEAYQTERDIEDEWREQVAEQVARWLQRNIEIVNKTVMLSDEHLKALVVMVTDALQEDKEYF